MASFFVISGGTGSPGGKVERSYKPLASTTFVRDSASVRRSLSAILPNVICQRLRQRRSHCSLDFVFISAAAVANGMAVGSRPFSCADDKKTLEHGARPFAKLTFCTQACSLHSFKYRMAACSLRRPRVEYGKRTSCNVLSAWACAHQARRRVVSSISLDGVELPCGDKYAHAAAAHG